MPDENPRFLFTLKEIVTISQQLKVLEQQPAEQCAGADAIAEILVTVI